MPQALHMLRIQSDQTRQHFLDDPDALKKWDEYADDVFNTFSYNLQHVLSSPLYPPVSLLISFATIDSQKMQIISKMFY